MDGDLHPLSRGVDLPQVGAGVSVAIGHQQGRRRRDRRGEQRGTPGLEAVERLGDLHSQHPLGRPGVRADHVRGAIPVGVGQEEAGAVGCRAEHGGEGHGPEKGPLRGAGSGGHRRAVSRGVERPLPGEVHRVLDGLPGAAPAPAGIGPGLHEPIRHVGLQHVVAPVRIGDAVDVDGRAHGVERQVTLGGHRDGAEAVHLARADLVVVARRFLPLQVGDHLLQRGDDGVVDPDGDLPIPGHGQGHLDQVLPDLGEVPPVEVAPRAADRLFVGEVPGDGGVGAADALSRPAPGRLVERGQRAGGQAGLGEVGIVGRRCDGAGRGGPARGGRGGGRRRSRGALRPAEGAGGGQGAAPPAPRACTRRCQASHESPPYRRTKPMVGGPAGWAAAFGGGAAGV